MPDPRGTGRIQREQRENLLRLLSLNRQRLVSNYTSCVFLFVTNELCHCNYLGKSTFISMASGEILNFDIFL